MKNTFYLYILLILNSSIVYSQSNENIQNKIIEAIDLVAKETIENPKDIVLVRKYSSDKFYRILKFSDSILVTNLVLTPSPDNIQTEVFEIDKDSISDVIWLKKNKFQSLKMTNSENPFKGINSRFPSKTFERLQPEIHELIKKSYLEEIKKKYGEIKVISSGDLHQTYFQLTKDIELISVPINYPQQARMNGTQGIVEIGYVLTTEFEIADLKVFRDLKDGCTESVINSIKELNMKMKEKKYDQGENIYIEESVIFKLN
jgi:hypothetical protein